MLSRWVDWRSEGCGELTGGRTCQHVSKRAAHLKRPEPLACAGADETGHVGARI